MRENREFICVTCPVGCRIDAVVDGDELVEISGNTCKRGVAFVQEELTAPRRMLTTTVQVRNGEWPLVPVRTNAPLPKGLLLAVAQDLRAVVLEAPVHAHQMVLRDVRGTGVDIVTSRAMPLGKGQDGTAASD